MSNTDYNPDTIKFGIETSVDYESGRITQEMDSLLTGLMRQVMDTRDQHIKECLIKMGWTPPSEFEEITREEADEIERDSGLMWNGKRKISPERKHIMWMDGPMDIDEDDFNAIVYAVEKEHNIV